MKDIVFLLKLTAWFFLGRFIGYFGFILVMGIIGAMAT
jgi:hypothetical protein